MKVCIAGADCFVGIPLVLKFASTNNEVIALVRKGNEYLSEFSNNHNIKTIGLDFNDYEKLGDTIGQVDCLMVLTWIGTRGQSRLDEKLQFENYIKVKAAIESAIDKGCKMILTAGSQAEYGLINGLIDENTLCKPNTEYGKYKFKLFNDVSKLCSERKVRYKEPRFFSLYGPGDFPGTLIMDTINKMRNNLECNFTESVQMWDYLYVDDAVNAVVQLCTKECKDGAYNFGSGDKRQLKEYIFELKRILGSNSKLNFGTIPYGPSGVVSIIPDVNKLKKEINWKPEHTFEEGIKSIINYLCLEK